MAARPAPEDAVRHRPVMLAEVMARLEPRDRAVYVDGTFGAGGYTRALLERTQAHVYAIDRDPDAIAAGAGLAARYPDRLTLIEGPFSHMRDLLSAHGIEAVDGIMLDVGVSSMQLGATERGFSFMADGPLDMRMSRTGPTAAEVVNTVPEADLAHILFTLGEERRSRAIARAIVRARSEAPLSRTGELAALVERVIGRAGADKIHPATRTFQALRIYVNDELGELERGLEAAEALLSPGGRLAVVSFHSLEDRIVKRFLAARTGKAGRPSRHAPPAAAAPVATFAALTKGAVRPAEEECQANPRARSARLRAAVRTAAPAGTAQGGA